MRQEIATETGVLSEHTIDGSHSDLHRHFLTTPLLIFLSVRLLSLQNRISRRLDHQRPWGAETSGRSPIQVTPEGDHGQEQI